MTTGRVFDIQRFSVHDGPGIRTTVFLKGCPLRCRWCQNPEGLERTITLWHFENLCGRTGHCQEVCPTSAITLTPAGVEINHAACTLCGDCVEACPNNALAFDGRDVTTEDVIDEIGRDAIFHEVSGGGVSFSGGEPLAQAEFVRVTATEAKARGVPTTLESSFHAPWTSIEPLLGVIDLFIVDIKVADSDAHRVATGVPNDLILANATSSRGGAPRDGPDAGPRAARPGLHGNRGQPGRDRRPRGGHRSGPARRARELQPAREREVPADGDGRTSSPTSRPPTRQPR